VKLFGLEIHDAGILCVDARGRLRSTETGATESPGFALAHGRELKLGASALHQARRQPRQINCRFWDTLSDQPLRSPEFAGYTHAELAYQHLKQVWQLTQTDDAEVILTVPDHYRDGELGLLLGIASALGLPVRGLISQALACVSPETHQGVDFHVDIQLHRLTLTAVDARPRPAVWRHAAVKDLGLEAVHRQWVKTLADAFVRQTRFDPLYSAETEQALYDRLPRIAAETSTPDPIPVEMQADGRTHCIQLERQALTAPYTSWIEALGTTLDDWQAELSVMPDATRLLVTHRVAGLPGFVRRLENATGLTARRLPAGTAATHALAYKGLFDQGRTSHGVPYLTRVPGPKREATETPAAAPAAGTRTAPTHLVYRGWAYPITDQPLVVGRELPADTRGILVRGQLTGISRRHFSVAREEGQVQLTDTSRFGTRVDEAPVNVRTVLQVGQIIRIGSPGETLQAIACLADHETSIA
jgi:hypothetical protein